MSETRIPASLRRRVIQRANNCCEYCRLSQADNFFTFHIDHIISEKHDGKTTYDNLCLSCPTCNMAKGSDIADEDQNTGEAIFLYNPRMQNWTEHFSVQKNGEISGTTPEARLTVRLLRFNDKERITERESLIKLGRYPCIDTN